jgi:hypothetical protein
MQKIDLTDMSFIQTIIGEIIGSERLDRQKAHLDAYKVFQGEVKTPVYNKLKQMRPKSYSSYTISDISLSSMVYKKIAKAYQECPIRTIEGSADATDNYNEILEKAQGDRYFREFDEVFNLQREALFWAYPRDGQFHFNVLAPYQYTVIRDKDTGEVQIVVLHYPSNRLVGSDSTGDGKSDIIAESQDDGSADVDTYVFWSNDQHVVIEIKKEKVVTRDGQHIKRNINFVPIEGNPNNVNPIGRLPFSYLSKDLSPDNPYFNPITEQTITFNLLMSELLTSANLQGTGTFILKYPSKMQGSIDNISYGLTTAIELPQDENPTSPRTEAEFINPNPDLAGQKESYMSYLRKVLSQHGITTSQGIDQSSENFSSGIERMIASADLQDIRNSNNLLFSMLEKDVFEIVKAWDAAGAEGLGQARLFQDDDDLQVYFPKPKVMISDRETLDNIKLRLELGLIQKHKALMILDPNLDEDEARALLEEINNEKMDNISGFLDGANTESDDQENKPQFGQRTGESSGDS